MNKRITSLLLCFVMVLSMLVTAVPVMAAGAVELKVTADKTEASPGDTITFTITLGPVSDMGTMQMDLVIPEGLTYVANSGKLADGLRETLGYDTADWTEVTKRINGVASAADYSSDKDTVLATFQCTVDVDASGTLKTGLDNLEFYSCQTWDDHTSDYTVVPATVNIVAKPVAVTGVTIDETLSLKTSESKTPSYTVNPAEATNKAVSFKSDNTAVATVNETTGEVTGVKEGTATITITTADGNFTDTCVVTVACSHANKTSVAQKASDCKNQGWDAYVKCDDCGQLFKADGTTEISEIPFRELSSEHTGGTATCTAQAVCTVCGNPYGDLAAHSYTAETKKPEALKTAGNCRDVAVYYYSCSACGKVENNDSHVFLGEKNANNHVGGTALVNQSEANHKTQTDGYTGDTKCLGCGVIIGRGQSIPAGAHTPAGVWSNDPTHHWKECTVVGCGIVIDGSKDEHSSTDANVATCQKAAVCDVCGVSYGTVADHDWNTSSWEKDATGHWHKCNTAGCTEKKDFATHSGGTATCTAQAVCTVCSQPYGDLAAHSYTAADKKTEALKSEGNCNDYAVYYYSCSACGKVEKNDSHVFLGEKNANNHVGGTALVNQSEANHKTQTDGYTGDTKCLGCGVIIGRGQSIPAGAHTPAGVWSNDPTHHWKECTVVGCGIVIDGSKDEHKSEKAENKAACEKQAVCDVCGVGYGEIPQHNYGTEKPEQPAEIGKTGLKAHYQCSECEKYFVDVDHDTHVEKKEVAYEDLIIPALVDNELTFEIPFSVVVKKTGDLDPAKETFTFKMFDLGYADTIYTVEGLTVETNGVNTYTGKLVIKVKESQFGNLSEGFKFAQVKGSADGWTYDETVYYIAPQISNTGVTSFVIFPGDDGWGNTTLEKVEFTNSYNKAQEPSQPGGNEDNKPSDTPQTGDNSMMYLWIILLCVSGLGVISTTVLGKKRFVK